MNTEDNKDIHLDTEDTSRDDEYSYDMEDGAVEEAGLQAKLKKLREELKAEKEKSTEYLTGWQKERASFANYKAEEERTRKERIAGLKTNLLADFFPVLDSFDMAFSDKKAWEAVDPAWRTGVEYIHTQFMNVLDEYQVSKIHELGVSFDPRIHEPIDTVATDNEDLNDTIAAVIQSGYKSGELVIRPAKVHVYRYEGASQE